MIRSATISPCRTYRYTLVREEDSLFDINKRTVLFVLNNPSKADAETDDNTSRKGWKYTVSWGYNRMVFVNTNPYRSTDPQLVRMPPENILAENATQIRFAAAEADLIVCAWGARADALLAARARAALRPHAVHVLVLTKDGIPGHPLYLKDDLRPVAWT